MEQGDEKQPFEERDNGVYRSPGNPFQQSIPPRPPLPSELSLQDGEANTAPIPIETPDPEPDDEEAVFSTYFFRRHLRDVLERLFVRSIGPRWYTYFVYPSLALCALPITVMVALSRIDLPLAWISLLASVLLCWYPVGSEVYRHRKRTVKLIRTARGVYIFYRQPTSLFWGFTGTGDEDESFLEGSTEIRKRIGLLNRFPFFGCGDLTIYGKVEGGKVEFENVPHVKRLQEFLSARSSLTL